MSYNIEYGHEGLDKVIRVIRDQHPDIVGLQEVDVHWSARSNFEDQAALLAKGTGMNYRFAHIYEIPNADPSKPPREFGVALLSRYPIVGFTNRDITRHSTQDSTAQPSPMPGLLEAIVDVRGLKVRVFNVHLDYRSDPFVRKLQVGELIGFLKVDSVATILTGDLNAGPNSAEVEMLAPYFLSGTGEQLMAKPPMDVFTYPANAPEKKIDYVMATASFCVTRYQTPKVIASDHLPVVVDLAPGRKCGFFRVTQ